MTATTRQGKLPRVMSKTNKAPQKGASKPPAGGGAKAPAAKPPAKSVKPTAVTPAKPVKRAASATAAAKPTKAPATKAAKAPAKTAKRTGVPSFLNGRTGVMLVGASLIFCVLMAVAILPTAAIVLAQIRDDAATAAPTLIAAPLVVVPVTRVPPAPAPEEPEAEMQVEGGASEVAALSLQPDIKPTPDGVYREVRVPILMYHYVSTPPDDADVYRLDLSVTPEQFEEQMAWLADEGYTTISLYDLTEALASGAELPEKPVILTFDDGYRDNYENAFPILQKYGLTGTFFILTGATDEGNPEYMSWEMLREMAQGGMSIEMHAAIHISIANQDPAALQFQVGDSADILEERLGYRPRFLAYPGGDYDEAAIEALKEYDYWLGLTTNFGCLHTTDNPYELQRIRIRGEYDLGQFVGLIKSAFENEEFCYGYG